MTNRVTFASGTKNCSTRKMNVSANHPNTPAPPPSALRRSSLGAPIRRRASMQTSLPTISEHHHHGNTKATCGNEKTATASPDSADDESNPKRNYQRRRSSVSFSSETPEVKEYRADTTPEHFYSERDILQFREEAKFERQQFRRASTGSSAMMYHGYRMAPPPGSYPYIGPMARRGSNSSTESDGCGGNNSPSSQGSSPNHLSNTSAAIPLPVVGLEGSSAYVPMITFAADSDQKKKVAAGVGTVGGLSARMSHGLNLAGPGISMPMPSGPVAPGTRRRSMDTRTNTQASPSYQFSNSGGFSVPLDQVRQHLGSASTSTNPADHLKGAQFVSVSCPTPDKPSTARIA